MLVQSLRRSSKCLVQLGILRSRQVGSWKWTIRDSLRTLNHPHDPEILMVLFGISGLRGPLFMLLRPSSAGATWVDWDR